MTRRAVLLFSRRPSRSTGDLVDCSPVCVGVVRVAPFATHLALNVLEFV